MAPLTATIFMFIVQFHDENFYGTETDKKQVSLDAASLTIALSLVLVAAIILLTWGYHTAPIGSVEALQKGVSLVDSGHCRLSDYSPPEVIREKERLAR